MTGPGPELRWSGTFAVDTLLKGPTGDKINLPSSALQQLLDANATAASAAAPTRFPSFEQNAHHLPYPLMFRLVNESNGKAVHAGVREFSAEEGHVVLSPFLLRSLGLESSASIPRVKVTAHQLPKGHYVGLSPVRDYAAYDPAVLEPLLERELRQGYTTLSVGTTLHVRSGLRDEYEFLVESVKPEGDGICVIDTDLELDLLRVPTATAQTPGAKGGGKAIDSSAGKSSPGGEIGTRKPVEGQVQHNEYVDYELTSWDKSRGLIIEAKHGIDPDASTEFFLDIFVSPKTPHLRERPRETQYWTAQMGPYTTRDPTRLEIPSGSLGTDEEIESVMISIYGFRDERLDGIGTKPHKFSLSVSSQKDGTRNNGSGQAAVNPEDTADKQRCDNCGQWIAKQNLVLHQLRCARNKRCAVCGLVAGADELKEHWHCSLCTSSDSAFGDSLVSKAKHDSRMHPGKALHCSCTASLEFDTISALARHRVTDCPEKVILCRFCHLEVPQEGDPTDPSSVAQTAYTGLTAHERADGARTADCDLCGAIVRLRDMDSHLRHHEMDKKGRARPVLCRNALCGRTLHGVGPRGQELADHSKKMRFCVDEAAQRNLVLAEMVASEGVWDLEWCVAACETSGDRDKAREWLQNWAPNKYE
ncbi:hypothetical protein MAPG_05160 [Magnaporthiopsis poae ATCC 64411]|uniref:Ubiquitin-protein ligase E3A N-terminal zinc-binding domain-containing protein n=1 Tax=Magnaporthiopsis poae (strain ATCC 64411 / 73-15) TaxID=644358 RepID=A0A0C4DYN4_MAGP6|nr:hypothetical protein MAPG_05160 [Magnaporthiopsis poae ATCC 64411]